MTKSKPHKHNIFIKALADGYSVYYIGNNDRKYYIDINDILVGIKNNHQLIIADALEPYRIAQACGKLIYDGNFGNDSLVDINYYCARETNDLDLIIKEKPKPTPNKSNNNKSIYLTDKEIINIKSALLYVLLNDRSLVDSQAEKLIKLGNKIDLFQKERYLKSICK